MFILNSIDGKNVKNKIKKEKNKLYKANLNDAIKARHNDFRKLQQEHVDLQNQLPQSTMWLKYHSILFSINPLQSKKTHLIELRHQEKHSNLIIEKVLWNRSQRNPNKIITYLANITLTQDEIITVAQDKISVLELDLKHGDLKHGVLLRPRESEMIAIAENVREQIEKHSILKNNPISKVRAQTILKSFTYNCVDLDIKQYISENNMIKVL